MPFFGGSRHHEPEPIPEPVPERRHGLFGRKPEPAVAPAPAPHTTTTRSGGLFGSRNHTSTSPSPVARDSMSSSSMSSRGSVDRHHQSRLSRTGGGGGSILSRKLGRGSDMEMDPSIVAARERVIGAEAAEAEADRALAVARTHVRDAREQMRVLQEELKEDARRAKIKQHQAHDISKRGKGLGRHG